MTWLVASVIGSFVIIGSAMSFVGQTSWGREQVTRFRLERAMLELHELCERRTDLLEQIDRRLRMAAPSSDASEAPLTPSPHDRMLTWSDFEIDPRRHRDASGNTLLLQAPGRIGDGLKEIRILSVGDDGLVSIDQHIASRRLTIDQIGDDDYAAFHIPVAMPAETPLRVAGPIQEPDVDAKLDREAPDP